MAKQIINIGNYTDDGTGDTLREGAQKINDNFTELYNKTNTIVNGVIAGDGIGVSYSSTTGRVTVTNTRVSESAFAVFAVDDNDSIQASTPGDVIRFTPGENIRIQTSLTDSKITFSADWPTEFNGDTYGTHRGPVIGNVTGNVTGDLIGDVYAQNGTSKILENGTNGSNAMFYGTHIGPVNGNVIGNVIGNLTGDVTGDVFGNADTVTNGIYKTDIGTVTNAMLAGPIPNNKLLNPYVTINSQIIPLGGTISIPEYELPIATNSVLGGIKIGTGLVIDNDGIVSTIQDIRTSATPIFSGVNAGVVTLGSTPTLPNHAATKSYVDNRVNSIPVYVLPSATNSILGGVKVGSGLTINPSTSVLSTTQDLTSTGSPTFDDITCNTITILDPIVNAKHGVTKEYVDVQIATIPTYTLPTATNSVLGGVKVGNTLTINAGTGVLNAVQDITITGNPTFANVTVTGSVTVPNAPATGNHAANKNYVDAYAFPIGGIIMWSGAVNTIPARWALCDGQNGTPDLRNRFVIGAGSTYTVNAIGGSTTATLTSQSAGAHSHSAKTGGTVLTEAQMPAHRHRIMDTSEPSPNNDTINSFDTDTYTNQNLGRYVDTSVTGGNQPHDHSISSDGAHTHTITGSWIPPYYALAYIMKIS